jgi:hypothetical protein
VSRGAGHVERAVAAAFEANPDDTFTISELAVFVYPGLNRVEKKHRVAIRRAAYAVAAGMHWIGYVCERPGGQIVFCNGLSLWSYTLGRARADSIWNGSSVEEIAAELRAPSGRYAYADRWKQLTGAESAFALHVRINRCVAALDHEGAARARAELAAYVARKFAA